jgi:hypothetical protein
MGQVLDMLVRNHQRMLRMAAVAEPAQRHFLAASAASLQASYNRARERLSNG